MGTEIGTILYSQESGITVNNLKSHKVKKGVWALFGRKKYSKDTDFYCLNVGKNINIQQEINLDIKWLNSPYPREEGTLEYYNQYAEYQGFKYVSRKGREYLYPFISDRYRDLTFILINDTESDANHEAHFAWATHSLFWRNGHPFKKERKNYYCDNLETVIGNINTKERGKTIDDWIKYIQEFRSPS